MTVKGSPVESFVIRERQTPLVGIHRALNVLPRAGKHTCNEFSHFVRVYPGIVANVEPAGHAADGLFKQQRKASFYRHADQQFSVRRQPPL